MGYARFRVRINQSINCPASKVNRYSVNIGNRLTHRSALINMALSLVATR